MIARARRDALFLFPASSSRDRSCLRPHGSPFRISSLHWNLHRPLFVRATSSREKRSVEYATCFATTRAFALRCRENLPQGLTKATSPLMAANESEVAKTAEV